MARGLDREGSIGARPGVVSSSVDDERRAREQPIQACNFAVTARRIYWIDAHKAGTIRPGRWRDESSNSIDRTQ